MSKILASKECASFQKVGQYKDHMQLQDTWLLNLVPFTLPTSIQESTKSHAVKVHHNYIIDPGVHFFKTFSFLATDGAKMALTANPRGDRLHSVAPAAFSACCIPKETPCKEPSRHRMIWEECVGEEPSGLIGLCFFHF